MHAVRQYTALMAAMVLTVSLFVAGPAWANHPVTVEGNCFGPGAGGMATGLRTSPVEPGTCGDYDGDGLIGVAENEDLDNNFGTINAALASVAQNGTVTVVANGTFPEAVRLAPVDGGSVTLEAAPGVQATLDAVVQGQAGNAERAGQSGVQVRGCASCGVTFRNLGVRNFAQGVNVGGRSHVLVQRVRTEGNVNFGIRAIDDARLTMRGTTVNATGFRKDAGGVATAKPGIGVSIVESARASIWHSVVSNSRGAGIKARRDAVTLRHVQVFGNRPNYDLRR